MRRCIIGTVTYSGLALNYKASKQNFIFIVLYNRPAILIVLKNTHLNNHFSIPLT